MPAKKQATTPPTRRKRATIQRTAPSSRCYPAQEQLYEPAAKLYVLERLLLIGVLDKDNDDVITPSDELERPLTGIDSVDVFCTGIGLMLRDIRQELEILIDTDFEKDSAAQDEQPAAAATAAGGVQ